ncbi:hypothetical protein LK13_04890 [Paenibacillus polymyxa]|uniref:hypothetical protein n=1 Tax=Paenibacillus polymyxa TaxID=1406 RepID=UPI00042E2752|nr:hypothetical protein [Paenibacillus polymyxa]AHM67175.1 hypothetical protein PPSQR21_035370 [Paenibacillus polymyxa SQR-21]AIY07971.1 hypothetical protein LK13_04890 [Paenibacillus polymyxa]UMR34436.1 hypothetical protein MJ749_17335 [Paenibacillus polymyxa]
MIIEIEGYFNQTVLQADENYSLKEIEKIYLDIKNKIQIIDKLPKELCKYYNMIEVNKNKEIKVDMVIDTDTDRIYKPYY